ncbi:hypothetical protein BU17DRAFT_68314 [Hysterangium stoloniferum]|nr:hypothetical protein BU17DRAFT_68314 [Hysterangium stoloniferum]
MLFPLYRLERIVLFVIRAIQSKDDTWGGSSDIELYEQLSLNIGYLIAHFDFLIILRHMVESFYEVDITAPNWRDAMGRGSTIGILVVLLCMIVNLVAGIRFPQALRDEVDSSNMYALRLPTEFAT